MITKIVLCVLVFITITSLLYSILDFSGKDIILNTKYSQATEEERKKVNKKAYRLQSAVIFLLISILSLTNVFRILFNENWITYLSVGVLVTLIIFYIVSSKIIKNKNKDSGQ